MLYDNIKRRNRFLHSHAPVYSMCRGNLLRTINSNYEAVGRISNVWPFYLFFFLQIGCFSRICRNRVLCRLCLCSHPIHSARNMAGNDSIRMQRNSICRIWKTVGKHWSRRIYHKCEGFSDIEIDMKNYSCYACVLPPQYSHRMGFVCLSIRFYWMFFSQHTRSRCQCLLEMWKLLRL